MALLGLIPVVLFCVAIFLFVIAHDASRAYKYRKSLILRGLGVLGFVFFFISIVVIRNVNATHYYQTQKAEFEKNCIVTLDGVTYNGPKKLAISNGSKTIIGLSGTAQVTVSGHDVALDFNECTWTEVVDCQSQIKTLTHEL